MINGKLSNLFVFIGEELAFDGLTDLIAGTRPEARDGLETDGFWDEIN